MTSIYTSQTAATSVDHCTAARFINHKDHNLVVARKNVLQIFSVNGSSNKTADMSKASGTLHLYAEFVLFGTICGLTTITGSGEGKAEHILVLFEHAKASLVRWDIDTHDLHTTSLHCFEREEYLSSLHVPVRPKFRADIQRRVSTLQISESHLAFMPVTANDDIIVDEDLDPERFGLIAGSFVLQTHQLQDDLTMLVDFCYLEGYREPTLALLYAAQGANTELKTFRSDVMRLVVLTLDLQMGARTAIIELDNLPSTLQSVSAVPEPVGGCLLLGPDQIIYVDPASRKVALAVNAFALSSSIKPSTLKYRDYSSLNLRLDGAYPVPLTTESHLDGILIIMANGLCGLLTLNLDGRTVTSLHLKVVKPEFGRSHIPSFASSHVALGENQVFIGTTSGNSCHIGWQRMSRSQPGTEVVEDGLPTSDTKESANDDLDDLYGDEKVIKLSLGAELTQFDLAFRLLDTLNHSGSVTGMTYGPRVQLDSSIDKAALQGHITAGEIVTVGGAGPAGNITVSRRSAGLDTLGKFDGPAWNRLWTVRLQASHKKDASSQTDTYLMASTSEETQLFTIGTSFVEKTDTEFESQDTTMFVATLLGDSCLVQVSPELIRTYDSQLKVLEMLQVRSEAKIVSAHSCDPYLLTVSNDGVPSLYRMQRRSRELKRLKWDMTSRIISGTLTDELNEIQIIRDSKHTKKGAKRDADGELKEAGRPIDCVCALITESGMLLLLGVPSLKVIHAAKVNLLPELITSLPLPVLDGEQATASSQPYILEIAFMRLGGTKRSPYMILRNDKHDVGLYETFAQISGALAFRRVPLALSTRSIDLNNNDDSSQSMQQIYKSSDVDDCACIFIRGKSSFWLIKSDHGQPHLHPAQLSNAITFASFDTTDAPESFIYCDDQQVVRIARHEKNYDFTNQWSQKRIHLKRTVHAVANVPSHKVYTVLTSVPTRYEIPDEEDENWEPRTEDRQLLPELPRGQIELVDINTSSILDTIEFAPNEQALCIASVMLTVATDYSKKKRSCLAVSTAIYRGEDLAMRGAVYVYDVVEVVPDETNPDAKYRLRAICREEVRAAATALCEVDGYLLSSQGQKVVIRSLEEDERLSPVAFVDLGLSTTTAKSLKGLLLFGDIQHGVKFAGFGEEPYKVTHFGRDYDGMDVMDAEFVVNGKSLLFAASDPTGNIRVMQYDPENSTTLAGQRLLRRADMHIGHVISAMLMIADPAESTAEEARTGVLCAASDGSFGFLLPITERSYRRLFTVQAQLGSERLQHAGLNPRAYRASTTDIPNGNLARGTLDGQLLEQFLNLSTDSSNRLMQNTGMGVDHVIQDLTKLQHFLSDY